jgi:hypothetical protein
MVELITSRPLFYGCGRPSVCNRSGAIVSVALSQVACDEQTVVVVPGDLGIACDRNSTGGYRPTTREKSSLLGPCIRIIRQQSLRGFCHI